VRTLGYRNAASDAFEIINNADNRDVRVVVVLSGHLTGLKSIPSVNLWFLAHGIGLVIDEHYPSRGSNHFKYTIFKDPSSPYKARALVGSTDIREKRWDTSSHSRVDPDRHPSIGPTHEVGVKVEGPAAADIERSFRDRLIINPANPIVDLNTPVSNPPQRGPQSVQILHTYGITSSFVRYPWADVGDFSCWASYLNAIKTASNYIYIEDQYFLPFDWPPCYERPAGNARESDIVYQLGEAIRRGVKVIVVTNRGSEDGWIGRFQKYQRNKGVHYLANVAESAPGEFIIASLSVALVHSKVMIVDDEFVLVGCANIAQRSMTLDGELHLGIVEEGNHFPRQLREKLWEEHLNASIPSDLEVAIDFFKNNLIQSRLQPYATDDPGDQLPEPAGFKDHGEMIRDVIDPYGGPPRS
jgi:phosphatidylserine/phosphatidylglycerophosphate/cardiolipin synthase-like enzyme